MLPEKEGVGTRVLVFVSEGVSWSVMESVSTSERDFVEESSFVPDSVSVPRDEVSVLSFVPDNDPDVETDADLDRESEIEKESESPGVKETDSETTEDIERESDKEAVQVS